MTMRTEQRHRPDDADAGGRLSAIGRATRLVLIPATYLLGLVVLSGGVGLAVPRLGAQDSGVTLWFGAVAGTAVR